MPEKVQVGHQGEFLHGKGVQALEVLERCPRNDGMWNSVLLVVFGQSLILEAFSNLKDPAIWRCGSDPVLEIQNGSDYKKG